MKLKNYTLYIVAIFIIACSPSYNLQSHHDEVIEVQAPVDSTVLAIITPYQNGIESQMNEVLCVSEMEMKKGRPESLLGNFVTDLCLNYADAHVCVMNTGGLRSSLPKGNITRGDIYTLMPFENELVVLELDIESFKGLVDYITKRGGEPFSGMTLKASSKGYDIEEVSRMEDYLDFNKGNKIRVLTSDYLANGGDKMWFFKDKEQNKVGIKLRDAIIDHCSKSDTISSKLDNRLIFTENE
ncbi:MAG: 5'-nucleotidase C-terminal domain-containing protein [Flavobacteriales bacterium]|nr:5'-nucleotidase C-terminal domain-containing protein [Flavobacteriales bacterium]